MDFFSILKQAIISSFTASQKDSTHAKWFEAFIKIKKIVLLPSWGTM